jgi:hypothetical protein
MSSRICRASLRAESNTKISFISFTTENESLESFPTKGFGVNDIDQKYRSPIVHSAKVSFTFQSIVHLSFTAKTLTGKGIQKPVNDVNDMNDIFTPLSAQPNFANFLANCGGTR